VSTFAESADPQDIAEQAGPESPDGRPRLISFAGVAPSDQLQTGHPREAQYITASNSDGFSYLVPAVTTDCREFFYYYEM